MIVYIVLHLLLAVCSALMIYERNGSLSVGDIILMVIFGPLIALILAIFYTGEYLDTITVFRRK